MFIYIIRERSDIYTRTSDSMHVIFLDKLKPAEKFLTFLSRFIKILSVLAHSLQIFQNYIYTDWFGNMSVHTRLDCLFAIFLKSIGSHRNDWYIGAFRIIQCTDFPGCGISLICSQPFTAYALCRCSPL